MQASYFQSLNQTLKNQQRAIPRLLLDLDRLDENIKTLSETIRPAASLRIVVKSLPALDLIHYLLDQFQTTQLMVFHQPFLTDLFLNGNREIDVLLGKPMPVKTAAYFFKSLEHKHSLNDPFQQIQWLVDTPKRIEEYLALAKRLEQKIRLNLEIDVGLHRGGFTKVEDLAEALEIIAQHPNHLVFSGLMGYDPHLVKVPAILRSQKKSLQLANGFYQACKDLIRTKFPALWKEDLTFNGAGSPTLSLHERADSPLNDISAGSCLVMPSTFDLPALSRFKAAAFIASPVLKKMKGTNIPGLERWKRIMNWLNKNNRQSFFIYGGYWKADYHYPPGLKTNALFGESSNQSLVNAPPQTSLEVDDFVFLRPQQSESVFLQFGKITVLRKGRIVEEWKPLSNE